VLRPGDPGYVEARTVGTAMVDRRPRVIVRCASVRDVVTAVRAAREAELEVRVRCGGHSVVGHAVPDADMMTDLTPMGSVQVDRRVRPGRRPRRRSVSVSALSDECEEGVRRAYTRESLARLTATVACADAPGPSPCEG